MKGLANLVVGSSMLAVHAMDGGKKPAVDPTAPTFDNVEPTTYSEYSASGRLRCSAAPTSTKECWADGEGTLFRYGCMKGDDRVLTDKCDEGCDNCEGDWKWGGERQGVCYNDGTLLYSFNCGGDAEEPAQPEKPKQPIIPSSGGGDRSAKSCEELRWPVDNGDDSVCGFSKVDNGECATGTYTEAKTICAAVGARLCTADELMADETKGTGCKGDCARVWSSTRCETGHHSLSGASKCAKNWPEECTDNGEKLVVRCCADTGDGEAFFPFGGDPNTFSPATAKDYSLGDGNCGVNQPINTYSCWTSPDKTTYRFACSSDDSFVYHQSCGTDRTCADSSCSGGWKKTGEVTEQCYSNEAFLYHYQCSN